MEKSCQWFYQAHTLSDFVTSRGPTVYGKILFFNTGIFIASYFLPDEMGRSFPLSYSTMLGCFMYLFYTRLGFGASLCLGMTTMIAALLLRLTIYFISRILSARKGRN